jgi:hypothetical protein
VRHVNTAKANQPTPVKIQYTGRAAMLTTRTPLMRFATIIVGVAHLQPFRTFDE